MLSLYPIDETELIWVVTYQRNKYSAIQTHYTGDYESAYKFYADFIDSWG